MRNVIALLVLVLCGCAGSTSTGFRHQGKETASGALSGPGPALAGAAGDDAVVQIVELPSLERWPRTMHTKGPFYGQLQLYPYVGQFGIVAEQERADAGYGFGAVVGYWLPLGGATCLGLEALYESSEHWNESSGVDAQATRTCLGLRASFRMDEKSHPFAVAGAGMYDLEFDSLDPKFNLSGMGAYFGGGFEYSPSAKFSTTAELRLHVWEAAEEDGSGGIAETLVVSVGAAMSF